MVRPANARPVSPKCHWLSATIIDESIGILTATITTLRRQTSPPPSSSTLREEPEIYESDPLGTSTLAPMTKLLREPLLHFVLPGGLLFAAYGFINREPGASWMRSL